MCDKQKINKEIIQLQASADSLELWLSKNVGHTDFEKVNRELNNIQLKIKTKKQTIERCEYPNRFNYSTEVKLPLKYEIR